MELLTRRFTFVIEAFWVACLIVLYASLAAAQAAAIKVCAPNDFWGACANKVKQAVAATTDPKVALQVGAEWAERYEALYKANAQQTWPPSDADRLVSGMESAWDDSVGKNLDPADIVLDQAMQKYFPRLAAALELASGPQVTFFMNLLAPSPIANDFTAAKQVNAEINWLVMSKLPSTAGFTIRQNYPELFQKGFGAVRDPNTLP